jgi:hypothetical protein
VPNRDYSDLFAAFNSVECRYLVVGAYAMVHYTEPRFTKDLDVWVDPDPGNAVRTFAALAAYGAPMEGVTAEDFADPGLVFQIGIAPNRVDVLMGLTGLEFGPAWDRSVGVTYDEIPIRILSLDDLIRNKRSLDRPQDRLDVAALEAVQRRG